MGPKSAFDTSRLECSKVLEYRILLRYSASSLSTLYHPLVMVFLGIDIGSSFVKAAIVCLDSDRRATAQAPAREMKIHASQPGHAEQEPDDWWRSVVEAVRRAVAAFEGTATEISAIGITYQMHGLVLVDRDCRPLRRAIIWCDSRAVKYGEQAMAALGARFVFDRLLNSPGNFTCSKLAWVAEHEPDIISSSHKILLPGDYIATCFTGEPTTTPCGLSEATLWDATTNEPARFLLDHFEIPEQLLPNIVPVFGVQGFLTDAAAEQLGLNSGIPITYRAGDQPNNAFSLGALDPGEVAATAGTSGVLYAVVDQPVSDPQERINSFLHVNATAADPRFGLLLCVNGCGILYSWLRELCSADTPVSYEQLNREAEATPPGAEGLIVLPFGNGAERMLQNRTRACSVHGLHFSRHSRGHLIRAAQEGVAFALRHGLSAFHETGVPVSRLRAARGNLFMSEPFQVAIASLARVPLDLYASDGAVGAALGAAVGMKAVSSPAAVREYLRPILSIEPDPELEEQYDALYHRWTRFLNLQEECHEQLSILP